MNRAPTSRWRRRPLMVVTAALLVCTLANGFVQLSYLGAAGSIAPYWSNTGTCRPGYAAVHDIALTDCYPNALTIAYAEVKAAVAIAILATLAGIGTLFVGILRREAPSALSALGLISLLMGGAQLTVGRVVWRLPGDGPMVPVNRPWDAYDQAGLLLVLVALLWILIGIVTVLVGLGRYIARRTPSAQ